MTGHVRELQQTDARKVKVVYEKPRWHEAWFNNPRIAGKDEKGDFQEFRPRDNYLRPYMTAKSHERWTWKAYKPPRGELYFKDAEMCTGEKFPDRVILEPNIKPGASPNKQWGEDRWRELARLLSKEGIRVSQMGPCQPNKLLPDAEFIWTRSMRLAATVIAKAKVVVVPEGGMHHVAAATGTPAVVLFGGYISPEVTGYEDQVNFYEKSDEHPLGCGWRVNCRHCHAIMEKITTYMVRDAILSVLKKTA